MTNLPQVGEVFDEKYEVLSVLGSGGLGSVYKARQLEVERIVALKIIHWQFAADEEFRARFLREAQLLGRLSHINIVVIYHLGISLDGFPYIAMELVRGKSIRTAMNERGRFPVLQTLRITRDTARALAYVHEQGVIHRDIKPDNILLTDEAAPDSVKIIDFGLASACAPTEQALTKTGQLLGTADYMSPEQCAGKKIDARSDVYSLTVCLYEMLTEHKPFEADSAVGIMYKHINQTAPRLNPTLLDRYHSVLDEIVQKGMNKDPEQRFVSMNDFAEVLCEAMGIIENVPAASRRRKPVLMSLLWPAGLSLVLLAVLLCVIQLFLLPGKKQTNTRSMSEQGLSPSRQVRFLLHQTCLPSTTSYQRLLYLHDAYNLCKANPGNSAIPRNTRLVTLSEYAFYLEIFGLTSASLDVGREIMTDVSKNGIPRAIGTSDELSRTASPTRDIGIARHAMIEDYLKLGKDDTARECLFEWIAKTPPEYYATWVNAIADCCKLQERKLCMSLVDSCKDTEFLASSIKILQDSNQTELADASIRKAQSFVEDSEGVRANEIAALKYRQSISLFNQGKKESALSALSDLTEIIADHPGMLERVGLMGMTAETYAVYGDIANSEKLLCRFKTDMSEKKAESLILPSKGDPLTLAGLRTLTARKFDEQESTLSVDNLLNMSTCRPEQCSSLCAAVTAPDAMSFKEHCQSAVAYTLCQRDKSGRIPRSVRLNAEFLYARSLYDLALYTPAIALYQRLLAEIAASGMPASDSAQGAFGIMQLELIKHDLARIKQLSGDQKAALSIIESLPDNLANQLILHEFIDQALRAGANAKAEKFLRNCRIREVDIRVASSCIARHDFDLAEIALSQARDQTDGTAGRLEAVELKLKGVYLSLEKGKLQEAQGPLKQIMKTNLVLLRSKKNLELCQRFAMALGLAGMDDEYRQVRAGL